MYSEIIQVKSGDSLINTFVNDTAERWGDYTDIQRKYNEDGVVWLCGSYGDSLGKNNVWISKLRVKNEVIVLDKFIAYPNPVNTSLTISVNFPTVDQVSFQLVNMLGEIVKEIKDEHVTQGNYEFLLNTADLSPGQYVLSLYSQSGEKLNTQKISVN